MKQKEVVSLNRLDSSLFDWLTWRNGCILDVFDIPHRTDCLLVNKERIRSYAIGWCPAEQVPCRPKTGYIAVMFQVKDRIFWTHLTRKEVYLIWKVKD